MGGMAKVVLSPRRLKTYPNGALNVLVTLIFSLTPIVDSLNGFLLRGGVETSISVGLLYRLLMLVALLGLASVCLSRRTIVAISASVCFMLFAAILHALLCFGGADAMAEAKNIVQWAFCPLVVFLLFDLYQAGLLDDGFARRTLKAVSLLTVLTILIPYVLGLGYSTYGGGEKLIGYKAFYYATNGVTLLVVVTFSFSLFETVSTRRTQQALLMIVSGVCLVLIGTKTAYFMLFASVCVVALVVNRGRVSKKVLYTLSALLFVTVVMAVAFNVFHAFFAPIVDRFFYFMNQSEDFFSFISSGRTDRIPLYIQTADSLNSIFPCFFGIGDFTASFGWCEMDYFDALFQYGSIGAFLLIGFSIWLVKNAFREGLSFCGSMVLFSLVYAAIVGHVFTNTLSSIVLAICFIGSIQETRIRNLSETKRVHEMRFDSGGYALEAAGCYVEYTDN